MRDDREAAHLYKLAADEEMRLCRLVSASFYEYGRGGLAKDDQEAARPL